MAFDAVVEVRPEVTVGGYDGLRVTIPSPDVDPTEIDARIDELLAKVSAAEFTKAATLERELERAGVRFEGGAAVTAIERVASRLGNTPTILRAAS